jgi:uncharacterized protein YjbI with pentapeptide repeats
MDKENARDADGFEPPKYLASLIGAINDGAKAAQGGAMLLLLVGLYLLATAFSASDEDLLLGRTVAISQIGAALPVSFSFAIAPLVFVFLHVYALVRYDMLSANVRHFLGKLRDSVQREAHREDCRQLLANVEFVLALAAPRGSRLYSTFWRWLFRGIVVGFPVFVLLLVQINALRYQSDTILWVQRAWLTFDLAALVWFFRRNALNGSKWRDWRMPSTRRWGGLLWAPVAVLALNLLYLNVVPTNAEGALVRYKGPEGDLPVERVRQYLADAAKQPLDVILCYSLKWGCRYLRVEHRTLVEKVWDSGVMAQLRSADADLAKALAGIEGLVLRDRSFRFAVLDGSRLYAADLSSADLSGASLRDASLSTARLAEAKLQGANLGRAQLQGAFLFEAQLQGTDLGGAQLQGSFLLEAQLQGTDLLGAQLQGAFLEGAQLQGANLLYARLQGANLLGAQLQGADLEGAQLQGADLFAARLWHVIARDTDFSLADLRGADFDTALTDKERADLRQVLDAIPQGINASERKKRLEVALATNRPPPEFDFRASPEAPVLVSAPPVSAFAQHPDWLVYEPTVAYIDARAELMVELAATNPAIAAGIVRNTITIQLSHMPTAVPIACGLLRKTNAGQVKLGQRWVDELRRALRDAKQDCPAAARPASEAK